MKKLLLLLLLFPAALKSMESRYSYKKNSCNLGYFGITLSEYECDKNDDRWEAFSGEKCVGSVKYNKSTCSLHALYVLGEYRGKKLGQALFLKALRDMRESGCKNVFWTSTQNAIPFYQKYGALLTSPDCIGAKEDFCGMFINLIQEK